MKFIRPQDKAASQNGKPPSLSSEIRQAKAIEKSRTPYIHLECGHTTDWDIDILYDVFRPVGPLKHFCERCGKWKLREKKVDSPPLPDKPLF